MFNMKVSVILPCYNSENTIKYTLDSINAQTFSYFECIIINDGSVDNTLQIINDYHFRSGIVPIIVTRENRGFLYSLHEGICKSNNELIARIDSDDLWEPNHLEKLVGVLEQEHLVFVGSNALIIDENSNIIGKTNVPTTNKALMKSLLNDNSIIHSSVIFRKSLYFQTSGYLCGEGDFFKHIADYNLWVELSFLGNCRNIHDYTVRYRFLNSSMSRNINRLINYRARKYVMNKMFKHYKKNIIFHYISILKVNLRILQNICK